MAIFVVVRNSRADEDSGQAELLASGVLTRSARLSVAVFIASLASLAVGVVSFIVLLLAALALAVAATLLAYALQSRRGFGLGVIAPRRGPARAGRSGTLMGLAVRINRGSMLRRLRLAPEPRLPDRRRRHRPDRRRQRHELVRRRHRPGARHAPRRLGADRARAGRRPAHDPLCG